MTLVASARPGTWWRRRLVPAVVVAVTVTVAWALCLAQDGPGVSPFAAEAWSRLAAFLDRVTSGSGEGMAEFERWSQAARLAVDTMLMSIVAAGLAGIGAIVTLPLAMRRRGDDPTRTKPGAAVALAVRAGYTLTRAVPELVWAFLVVFVLRPGIIAGAVALAIHNFGVLGRLAVDVAENSDPRPIAALEASGGSRAQVFAYGILPQVLPGFITFLLFRWEVIIRTTVVVGFVVGSGLGYRLRLDLSFFRYSSLAVLLLTYLGVVLAVDAISAGLRRLAR